MQHSCRPPFGGRVIGRRPRPGDGERRGDQHRADPRRLAARRPRHTPVTLVRSRLAARLLVGQVALSLVLLVGSGLFVRRWSNLQRVDPGFDSRNLVDVHDRAIDQSVRRPANGRVVRETVRAPGGACLASRA
jgi:hypothetical protein